MPTLPMQTPSTPVSASSSSGASPSLSWKKAAWLIFGTLVLGASLATAGTLWWVRHHFYASRMNPVSLSAEEQKALDAKLENFSTSVTAAPQPEAPVQTDERTLWITAKEINAYLAKQGLGESFRVALSRDVMDVTMIAPIPEESGVPLLSGTTLRVKMSLALALDSAGAGRCVIQDVRVGGVPLPNAWLGDIKGINLVENSVDQDPVMKWFWEGIQEAQILPEGVRVVLRE